MATVRHASAVAVAVDELRVDDLPAEIRRAATRRTLSPLEEAERDAILRALGEAGGNRLQTAARLGISRSTLYAKLRAYGLELDRTAY